MTPSFGTGSVSVSPGTAAATAAEVQTPIEPALDWTPPPALDTPSPADHHPHERERERKPSPRVRRLKAFLESLDLTMYHISQVTARAPFGKGTRAHIRDAF